MLPLKSTSELRVINRGAVLRTLARKTARGDAVNRQYLAQQTGLTTAAISRITRQLIDAGVLRETSNATITHKPGRRTRELQFTDNGAFLVVMVISANRRSVAIVNCKSQILVKEDLDNIALTPAKNVIKKFCDKAKACLQSLSIPHSRVLGVSVVLAVNSNPVLQETISAEVLGWHDVDLKRLLQKHLSFPVYIEARSVALLQAELWRASTKDYASVFLVNNGWRLGSCAFVNNRLLEAGNDRLGQVAHLTVPADPPTRCYCGENNCLDALCSGEAIVNELIKKGFIKLPDTMPPAQKLSVAIEQANSNASVAAVFRRAGEYLGQGLNGVQSLFATDCIFLAGAISRQADFVAGVKKHFSNHNAPNSRLETGTANSLDAAICCGLNEFLFSDSLNLKQLEQAPFTPALTA